MSDDTLRRYLPEEVPDHLFTQNNLNLMGLAATSSHEAYIFYPEQKREYKLYDIAETRQRKQQKGFSFVSKDWSVEKVLEKRRHELSVRHSQYGEKHMSSLRHGEPSL